MKKRAKQFACGLAFEVKCPFCGASCDPTSPLSWCAGCYTEWTVKPNGDVVFDTELKTPRFAWAKAIAKAGGMRIASKEALPPDAGRGEG